MPDSVLRLMDIGMNKISSSCAPKQKAYLAGLGEETGKTAKLGRRRKPSLGWQLCMGVTENEIYAVGAVGCSFKCRHPFGPAAQGLQDESDKAKLMGVSSETAPGRFNLVQVPL